jgi:hypothetical protein
MTITLNISEDLARLLEAQAAQHGRSVEEHLLRLAIGNDITYDQWRERLESLSKLLPVQVPSLPDEALRRETMYRV